MARYQVILAYDGTRFLGFQRQAKGPTVQAVVEAALRQLDWQGKAILAAGRTDTGVHASGQVIAFDLEWKHSPEDLRAALNAHLPPDVAVQAVHLASLDFHPRYQAAGRRYRYRLFCQAERHPLRERYAWRVWPAVALESLQEAARPLLGTHDFAAFGTPPRSGGSTIRRVSQADWQLVDGLDGPELVFEIVAGGFLYRMVRRLVFVQVAIGQGQLHPEIISRSLEEPPPYPLQGLAPPQGLVLVEVSYPKA